MAVAAAGAALALLFCALGAWQLQRLAWKNALVARVTAAAHAPPVDAPGPAQWSRAPEMEYRRVQARGRFLHRHEALVPAVTALGGGYWVMTPLRAGDGVVIYVNRGFVPPDRKSPASRGAPPPEGEVTVSGLLRLPEPGGGFLRRNDPAADRWYSRDVVAMARRAGLSPVAPWFIDAAAAPDARGYPVGGLTRLRFSNSHLVYALTWFALALLSLAGAVVALRHGRDDGPA
ncbi:SURF1 family protein [Camelimonas abortus]|uniref:SURF1-like protein n=1 Tax=Camelimonas abortus TaxID=1017184 RepID=A0ABV7LEU5_9HYPH